MLYAYVCMTYVYIFVIDLMIGLGGGVVFIS
jgi:hypothetical protein